METNVAEATAPVPALGWTEAGLALMVLVWGINFSVVKWALDVFAPLGFNALRFLLASLFVLVVLRARGPLTRPARGDLPRIVLLGLVGNVIYQLCFIIGIDLTRAGNASLMLALAPLFTALLSAWTGDERPGTFTWLGGGTSLLGVGLVSGSTLGMGGAWAGDLILLGASLIWAVYTVGARPLVQRYGSVQTTAWTLWVGTAGLIPLGAPELVAQDWGVVGAGAWGGLLFSAFLSIGLAYLIWYRGVQRIGNTRTAIFSNLTPGVALVVGAVWLGEDLTSLAVLGAILTVGGVLLVRADRSGGQVVRQAR